MAQSPLEATSPAAVEDYLKNWDALSSMITRGRPFSGLERHCCFLNMGTDSGGILGRFADVSAATGFDLIDDGRALARVDWDRDGDLDFWITNRGAPRLRLLKNNLPRGEKQSFVGFTLEGTACNRDAVGAVLELTIGGRKHTRVLRAGEGFLGQSSKRVHFGLGDLPAGELGQLTVRWPGSASESFGEIAAGTHYHLRQGAPKELQTTSPAPDLAAGSFAPPKPTEQARIVLTARVPAPLLEYVDFSGQLQRFDPDKTEGKPTLINLWASWCGPCVTELNDFAAHHPQLAAKNLRLLAFTIEAVSQDRSRPDFEPAKKFVKEAKFPFQIGATDANGLRLLTVLHNQIFARERPLPLPTSFLIDKHGNLAVIYKGPVEAQQLLADIDLLEAAPRVVAEAAFPFPSRDGIDLFSLGDLDFAKAYQDGGYLEDARREARKAIDAANDAANQARAWFYLGTLEQSARQWAAAAAAYGKAVEFAPTQPLLEVARGAVLWQNGEQQAARQSFAKAAQAKPDDPNLLNALAKAHLQIGLPAEAIPFLEKALSLLPNNLTLARTLALAQEQAGNFAAAITVYRELLKSHPDSADLKNNLAYLLATCPDPALRNGEEALTLATEANAAAKFSNPSVLDTLAAAHAVNGDYQAALKTLAQAWPIAHATGSDSLVTRLREKRLEYTSKLREASPSND